MMIVHKIKDNPEKIWLEPGCSPERCWCENALDDCEEPGCGAKAVGYVREDIVDHAAREAAGIADENARLRAALLTGVLMLSEMGLDPREKCQMAYDYMSAALEGKHE